MYDISVELSEHLPSWPNEARFRRTENHFGDICVSEISMTLHTGTHFDAPYHFIPGGKRLGDFPPGRFTGRACVWEIKNTRAITLAEIRGKNPGGKAIGKVLFKTCNSALWQKNVFDENFIGLEPDAAKYLLDCGIDLAGIDYLSIEAYHSIEKPVHHLFLGNDVLVLEGLNLTGVPEGEYTLAAFPLKVKDSEAAPARAVLLP